MKIKSKIAILSVLILGLVGFMGITVNAQHGRHMMSYPEEYYNYPEMGYGMMGYGMMGYGMMGNMGCPMFMNLLRSVDFYLAFAEELELNNEQIDRMKNIRNRYEKDAIEKSADLMEMMFELRTELSEDDIELNKIKGINQKIESIQSELRYRNIEAYVKARGILTEEQRRKIFLMEMPFYRGGRYPERMR